VISAGGRCGVPRKGGPFFNCNSRRTLGRNLPSQRSFLSDVLPENWTIPNVMPQLHRGPLCGFWVNHAGFRPIIGPACVHRLDPSASASLRHIGITTIQHSHWRGCTLPFGPSSGLPINILHMGRSKQRLNTDKPQNTTPVEVLELTRI
jgi:hypothetical protein